MKRILAVLCTVLALFAFSAAVVFAKGKKGDVYTEGSAAKKGTYAMPHKRTAPNATTTTRIKMNPYTGQKGTIKPGW